VIKLYKEFNFLSEEFLNEYKTKPVKWGFASGPNSLGEITYRRTYSRDNEEWWQTVQRVVEGTYEVLYSHCTYNNIPFDINTSKADAQKMYDLIFNFKFLPPGRGLWVQGTEHVRQNGGMALNNCAFVSTSNIDQEFDKPFRFLMDVSMLGVGCGFDTKGANKLMWSPSSAQVQFQIPDSREGWVESLGMVLRWGFGAGPFPVFDYSLIREKGAPIKGFGGVSEGPAPLKQLHENIIERALERKEEWVNSRDITDIMNMIGVCVVAGNVRRSAEIALGEKDDELFLNLKNYEKYPERANYGWASNNSLLVEVGDDYSQIAERIADNGEPGLVWLDNIRKFGRMTDKPDNKDWRVMGTNPCAEQSLESYEVCNLVETFPFHHKTLAEYKETLKYAFIYAKAVSLLPTHIKETNAVMLRNRRIGTSMSGVAQFIAHRGVQNLIRWSKAGYQTILHYDKAYSEWLCVRESIKKTSIKPSGTVSLLAGATPGCHYPTHRYYIRRIRFAENHPDLVAFQAAGYKIEPAKFEPGTMIVEFPVAGDDKVPTETEVSVEDKVDIAILLQEYWADNQVSCTATFDPESEKEKIFEILKENDKMLKSISFLPMLKEGAYEQMPYEAISKEQYDKLITGITEITWTNGTTHDQQDNFCDGLACTLPGFTVVEDSEFSLEKVVVSGGD
jgi:ribonucleoside-triphosphate reductase